MLDNTTCTITHKSGPFTWNPFILTPITTGQARTVSAEFTTTIVGIDEQVMSLNIDMTSSLDFSNYERSVISNLSLSGKGIMEQLLSYEWALICLINELTGALDNLKTETMFANTIELLNDTHVNVHRDGHGFLLDIINNSSDDTHVFEPGESDPFTLGGGLTDGVYTPYSTVEKTINDISHFKDSLVIILSTFRLHKVAVITNLMEMPYHASANGNQTTGRCVLT